MRPQGIPEDYIKMKAFPFSLDRATKDWLKRTFLDKFFPTSRTTSIRKEICGIRKHTGETLHEYWERFNKLCSTCPYHQISETINDGQKHDRRCQWRSIDGQDTTSSKAPDLQHGKQYQQFRVRGPNPSQIMNKIGVAANQGMENQLAELTSIVRHLSVGQQQQPAMAAKICGICTSIEHLTNMCPTLQEIESNQPVNVGAIGGYQVEKKPYQSRPLDN
ncbi:hypothetical protein CR513_05719, partial [Mucuna pruriens]